MGLVVSVMPATCKTLMFLGGSYKSEMLCASYQEEYKGILFLCFRRRLFNSARAENILQSSKRHKSRRTPTTRSRGNTSLRQTRIVLHMCMYIFSLFYNKLRTLSFHFYWVPGHTLIYLDPIICILFISTSNCTQDCYVMLPTKCFAYFIGIWNNFLTILVAEHSARFWTKRWYDIMFCLYMFWTKSSILDPIGLWSVLLVTTQGRCKTLYWKYCCKQRIVRILLKSTKSSIIREHSIYIIFLFIFKTEKYLCQDYIFEFLEGNNRPYPIQSLKTLYT